ncbi:putative RNA-directed DNA polymerase from transposon X-element [Frankliniella fusca]|uniref:RNA-directed DNA polymerase from transposon X-element n=1 Tax=Frankliniella fusca TaxID=407009 RepID=A0AAE1H6G8_9NEOP|nr:putative RNA-directed DNA polymerase from transposon X-element [Frankliniella fusca]
MDYSNSNKPMNIITRNINGLRKRVSEIELLIDKYDPDIILLQENLLSKTTNYSPPKGYGIIRKERDQGYRGGVAILIKEEIDYHETNVNSGSVEMVTAKIHLRKQVLSVSSIYCPPSSTTKKRGLTTALRCQNHTTIIGGDLNAKHAEWGHEKTNNYGKWIAELTAANNLQLHVPDEPTRIANRRTDSNDIFDYFITDEETTTTLQVLSQDFTTSDHLPSQAQIITLAGKLQPQMNIKTNWFRVMREIDRPYNITEDIDYDVRHLTATIQAAILNNSTTVKKKRRSWHRNPLIKTLVWEKKQANKNYSRTRTAEDKTILKQLKRRLKKLSRL